MTDRTRRGRGDGAVHQHADIDTEGEGVTLTEFLRVRIAEDEAAARRASDHPDSWGVYANDNYGHLLVQPSRVLAECEALAMLMEWHHPDPDGRCVDDHHYPHPCPTLGIVAAIWRDHPDFDESWRV